SAVGLARHAHDPQGAYTAIPDHGHGLYHWRDRGRAHRPAAGSAALHAAYRGVPGARYLRPVRLPRALFRRAEARSASRSPPDLLAVGAAHGPAFRPAARRWPAPAP